VRWEVSLRLIVTNEAARAPGQQNVFHQIGDMNL